MRKTGSMSRLTVLIGEADRFHHHSLSAEILQRAHGAGLAGASVFHGVSGFGASGTVHSSHVLSLSDELPLAIVIVDEPQKIQDFLPSLSIVESGLVTVEPVEAV